MNDQTLLVDFNKDNLKGVLHMMEFPEGDSIICYCPALQISSYGDDAEEAHRMMQAEIQLFIQDLFKMGELKGKEFLKSIGWEKGTYFNKRFINLSETTFDDIKKEFNLPDTTTVRKKEFSF